MQAQTCAAPIGITSSSSSAINATLSWTAVSGALYYKIKVNPVNSPNSVKNYTSINNNLVAAALTPMTDYECRIATVCLSGAGAYSNPIVFSTTSSGSCGVPQNISSFAITTSNVSLKWTPVVGAQSYQIKLTEPGGVSKLINTTNPPFVLTGLKSSTTYTYTVNSICSNIPGASSAPLTFTTAAALSCGTPTGLTATKIFDLGAKISWNPVPGASTYKLTVTAVAVPIPITHTNIVGTSFDLIGLLPNSAYTYKVVAVCSGLDGQASTIGTFSTSGLPCLQPSFVTVNGITATTANVSFIKGAVGNNAMTRVFLTQNGDPNVKTFSSLGNSVPIANLLPNTTYNYQLASVCNGDENTWSAPASFTTGQAPSCTPPNNIAANNVSSNEANITWTPILGVSSYTVALMANDSILSKAVCYLPFYNAKDLTPNTPYKLTVSANCIPSIAGTPSTPVIFSTLALNSCSSPSSINVTDINVTKAKFSWSAVQGVTKYRLMILQIGSKIPQYFETSLPTYTISTLEPNKNYAVCVASICNGKVGGFCPASTFSTLVNGNCPPPTNLATSNLGYNSAKITWDSMPGTISWSLLVYPSGMPNLNYMTTNTASFMATNLLPNRSYDVIVMANCPFSTLSASSSMFTFTTPSLPSCTDTFEPNNTIATGSTLTAGTAINAGIHTSGDVDYFKITTTQVQPYLKISLTNLPADFDLKLLSASGLVLKTSEKLGSTNEIMVYNVANPASYNLMVYGFGPTFVASKCYQLLVETSATPFGTGPGISLVQATQPNTLAQPKNVQTVVAAPKTTTNLDLKVYPNPAYRDLTVDFNDEFRGKVTLTINDLQGRSLHSETIQIENSQSSVLIDLSDYSDGLYLMSAQSETTLKTYKIVLRK
jgi:Secretion system C-terminal sorting domain/Fibronectin type III domain